LISGQKCQFEKKMKKVLAAVFLPCNLTSVLFRERNPLKKVRKMLTGGRG